MSKQVNRNNPPDFQAMVEMLLEAETSAHSPTEEDIRVSMAISQVVIGRALVAIARALWQDGEIPFAESVVEVRKSPKY